MKKTYKFKKQRHPKWKRLTDCRKNRELTQTELAELSELSVSMISQYEAGVTNPTYESFIKLATALNVSCDYLANRTNDNSLFSSYVVRPNEFHLSKFVANVRGVKEIIMSKFEFEGLKTNLFLRCSKKQKEFIYNGVVVKEVK